MKFLDVPELSTLTSYLTGLELGDRKLSVKLEAYVCKQVGDDRKLANHLEAQYQQEIAQMPAASLGSSPLGTFADRQTRRLLISLICTMNATYPDYDFSRLKPEDFMSENVNMVINSVNSHFAEIVETHNKTFLEELWSAIDKVVHLKDCRVYSYIPDLENDPFSVSGSLWSFNYFFYSKADKRILFFAASCKQNRDVSGDEEMQGGGGANDGMDEDIGDGSGDEKEDMEDRFEMFENEYHIADSDDPDDDSDVL